MLHEGLGSVSLWRDLPQRLCERTRCTVVAYSRYGYGRSDVLREKREPEYMHHEGEVVLPELLAQLGVERPILFGHSDGASIALIFAGAHPDAVRALVLEAPHVFVEEISVRSIAAAKTAYATTDLPAKLGAPSRRRRRDVLRLERHLARPALPRLEHRSVRGARALPGAADPRRRRRVRYDRAARRDSGARSAQRDGARARARGTARTATRPSSCSIASRRS